MALGTASQAAAEEVDAKSAQANEFFETHIRPLLVKRCFECHGTDAKRLEGGLLMNSRESLIEGGDNGAAVVPGKPDESLLIDAISYEGDYEMPPKGKLPEEEIALLTKWVEMGVPFPASSASADTREKFDLEKRRKSHWAWQPIGDPAAPKVNDADWPLDPIDNFILARLEENQLTPNGPAGPGTLVRRLYFDIIGLPPTEEQMDKFLRDCGVNPESADDDSATRIPQSAIESLVEELLASPHFGERWGRHWLDLMRYAESRGHEFDYNVPNPWEYRDYVIRAINADVPYDQFVVEHIAGDLVEEPRRNPDSGFNESIIGTGFWHLGEWVHSPVDIREDECDRLDNQIAVFGKTFLGMTIACARCHDHKFDAISQRDYYAVAGYVQSSAYRLARFETLDLNRDIAEKLHELREGAGNEVAKRLAASQRPTVENAAKYLIAAREAVLSAKAGAGHAEANAASAKKHQLDASVLTAWVEQLDTAQGDAGHPLHLWAKLVHEGNQNEAHLKEVAAGLVAELKKRADASTSALDSMEVIVDYGTLEDGAWMADGSAFGVEPMRIGDPLLTTDPKQPFAGFATHGAARRDTAFRNLKLAGGTMNDHGKPGGWQRVGQSVGTPTFTVNEGPVHYLVRGAGRAFAVVDSHRLIQGPLHGEVLYEWNDDTKGQVRWVTHNLTRHKGHRVHVEFSPRGGGDLEILLVAQGKRPNAIPFDTTGSGAIAAAMPEGEAATPAAIAAAYQKLLANVNAQVSQGIDHQQAKARDIASIANWMVQSPKLFAADEATPELITQGEKFIAAQDELTKQIKNESRAAMAMWDGFGENEKLLIRGNHSTTDGDVTRRHLSALGGSDEDSAQLKFGSGRLGLARRIVDPSSPLPSRVMVNRIWHHLTGRGIVPTTDNFGVLGMEPSHPELLDHLATRFMREGWSVKRMIKTIVMTRMYQMSSLPREAMEEKDPSNQWLHRMRIRRLQGEVIRDAMLTVSGRLDKKMYGPSVPVHLTAFMTGRGRPGGGPLDGAGRRSIYTSVRRNFLSPMMLAFDMPQPSAPIGRRTVSNVPAQALIMMNDPLVIQQADLWAKRLLAKKDLTPGERITKMYQQAFARGPSEAEVTSAMAFLNEQAKLHGVPEDQAASAQQTWADLCHVMFNVKEFIFIN